MFVLKVILHVICTIGITHCIVACGATSDRSIRFLLEMSPDP